MIFSERKILTMTMKPVFSLIVLLFLSASIHAQEKTDTLGIHERPFGFSGFYDPRFDLSDDYIIDDFNRLKFLSYTAPDSSSIWMSARHQLSGMLNRDNWGSDVKSNILNPLSQQYSASQRMKEFKSVLAAIQVGAVGYLAYQHLKKYGFLKKK